MNYTTYKSNLTRIDSSEIGHEGLSVHFVQFVLCNVNGITLQTAQCDSVQAFPHIKIMCMLIDKKLP